MGDHVGRPKRGQVHAEGGSFTFARAFCIHGPVMHLDQMLHDREPETEPAVTAPRAPVLLPESIEYERQNVGRDSLALVGHRDLDHTVDPGYPYFDGCPLLRELHGIAEQIEDDLLEALRISMIFNLTGVILAEMYASRDGIGHQIATWGENFQMKQLLAGVVMVAAIAMTFNELVRWVETRCSHWRT